MEPSKVSAYSIHEQNRTRSADTKALFRYPGSLLFNLGAFFLPALYSTLSRLWVANIDSSQVVLTDIYTYIGIVAEILNDAFPRSAWHVIGDKSTRLVRSRLNLASTLMMATAAQGFILMVIFLAYPQSLASAFVSEEVRGVSLTYVRLYSVQMGETYTTAWGVFNTIRWGLVMVPVQALESSTLAFVGHAWGAFRASSDTTYPRASCKEILSRSGTEEKVLITELVL